MSVNKQLHESQKYLQRRFSTSTRFSIASQNLEHDDICKFLFFHFMCCVYLARLFSSNVLCLNISAFTSLKNYSFVSPQKNNSNLNENNLKLNKTIDFKEYKKNKNKDKFINSQNTPMCAPSQLPTKNINSLSNNVDK